MAWRLDDIFYLAPGATFRIEYYYGDQGDDKGPQWAMGHPISGPALTALATERVMKVLDCSISKLEQNGAAVYSCDPGSLYWLYQVDITNLGTGGCTFQLEGGGI
jgi:hypothetical protein